MIIIFIVLYIILMLIPVLGGLLHYKLNQGEVLYINQNRNKDPRYFGNAFAKMIQSALSNYHGDGVLELSKKENIVVVDKEPYQKRYDKLVVALDEEFKPLEESKFEKEIYSRHNVWINKSSELRALYSEGDIVIKENTKILRWVDAIGTVAVYDNCNLGISITSKEKVVLGKNCTFRRIFAPMILIGQYIENEYVPDSFHNDKICELSVSKILKRDMQFINDTCCNDAGIAEFSLTSRDNITVVEKIIVQGDIHSQKCIRLCDGVVVCGNLYAEEDIYVGQNCIILGTIFSQGNIDIDAKSRIGSKGNIVSVIARGTIEFMDNCCVYGYISNENGGVICKSAET